MDVAILPYFKNIYIHEICTDKSKNNCPMNENDGRPSKEQSMKVIVINHEGGEENEKRLDKIQIAWDYKFNTTPSSRTDIPARIVGHDLIF